jgi:hypothetical protein
MKKNGKEERNIEPIKLTKKEIKELKAQFPEIEEKASWIGITVMILGFIVLACALYFLYLTLTYQV